MSKETNLYLSINLQCKTHLFLISQNIVWPAPVFLTFFVVIHISLVPSLSLPLGLGHALEHGANNAKVDVQSQYRPFAQQLNPMMFVGPFKSEDSVLLTVRLHYSLKIFLSYNFHTALTQNSCFYCLRKHSWNSVIPLHSFFLPKILMSYKNYQLPITGNAQQQELQCHISDCVFSTFCSILFCDTN